MSLSALLCGQVLYVVSQDKTFGKALEEQLSSLIHLIHLIWQHDGLPGLHCCVALF